MIELKYIIYTGTHFSQNIHRQMSLLSNVVVIYLTSISVLTPTKQFWDCATFAFTEQYYFHMVTEENRNSLECGSELLTSSLSWLGRLDLSQEKCSDDGGKTSVTEHVGRTDYHLGLG